jgi:anti-sigma regulatory factor (Ser/Thr protein kinase)
VVALTQWLTTPGADDACWLRVESPSAVVGCRHAAVAMAGRLGFPAPRTDQLALAVTEAASNLHKHAREGSVLLRVGRDGRQAGVELVTIDAGPGVPDVGRVLRDGHSTTGTLGIGLGAIRRLADSSDLYSVSGHGTALAARFWPQPYQPASVRCAGLNRPISGETECGDIYAAAHGGSAGDGSGVLTGVLCDGLGHGPLAAAAARAAIAAVREDPAAEPAALLERAHRQMARTRGGALAIVRIDGPTVTFAGLGNIAAWIVTNDLRSGMVSIPGIAGHQARTFRQYSYPLPPGSVVVLHSDGLTSRWDIRALPGLVARDPLVIAAELLGEAAVRRDDAGVLVLKP